MKYKKLAAYITAAALIYNCVTPAMSVKATNEIKNAIYSEISSKSEMNLNKVKGKAYIENEVPRSEMTATATSEESADPASAAIDGNVDTLWHTPWNGSAALPQSLTIDLGKTRNISSLKVEPRKDSTDNGRITNYEIYAVNGEEETLISKGKWENNSSSKIVSLDTPVEAEAIKITALQGIGGWASVAEVNVYEMVGESTPLASNDNIRLVNNNSAQDISSHIDSLKNLEEGTIVTRFRLDGDGIQTLLGISNNKTNNGYFSLYVNEGRVGFEVRNQTQEGNTPDGTTNLAHEYADVALNKGFNTLALKIDKDLGYKIYLNGSLVKETSNNDAKFLDDIQGLNAAFIGKTDRNSGNEYNFNGDIDYIDIYADPLSDNYLLKETSETSKPNEDDFLPDGAYKSEPIDLFSPGDLNSNNYRIPALYTTQAGTVLASIDARITHGGDSPNNIDSAIRRKELGKDWEEGKIILDFPAAASAIDTSMIQDEETGRIFLLVTHFSEGYGFPQAKKGTGYKEIDGVKYLCLYDASGNELTIREEGKVYDKDGNITNYTVDEDKNLFENGEKVDNVLTKTSPLKVFGTSYLALIYSDDDGKTWSKPKDLNPETKEDWMKFMGTGPGRGIQIKNGAHAGRIIFPIYYTNASGFQSSAVVYSDDKGETWHRGESPNDSRNGHDQDSDTITSGNQLTECQVVEMPNGQLKMFMRNTGSYVRISTSFDGGETWHEDVEEDTALREPYCQLSVMNYSGKIDGKDAVIFANPDAGSRSNGSVKIGLINENGTYENGETRYTFDWKYNKVVKPGYYAYSCLTELPDGKIGLFYEGTPTEEMSYTEMNVDYIKYNPTEQAEAAKIESVKLVEEKEYLPGEEVSLKVKFNQSVSLMGDRKLTVNLNGKDVEFLMVKGDSPTEFIFKGTLPTELSEGAYDLVAKANEGLEIYNVYGKKLVLSEDTNLSLVLNVKSETPEVTGKVSINGNDTVKVNSDLNVNLGIESLKEGVSPYASDYTLTYDPEVFTFKETSSLVDNVLVTSKLVKDGEVRILAASLGGNGLPVGTDFINVILTAKASTEDTIVSLTNGEIADGEGTSYKLDLADKTIKVEENVVVPSEKPGKAEGLKVTETTSSTIKLDWETPSKGGAVKEYIIYKDSIEIARVSKEVTEYIVENLKANTLYGFKIVAIGEDGENGRPVAINARTSK
ncbi:sialidase domain-containing protein [Clostridium tarantellae]|nr:sialidase domain-containing protein [Clostridium tarantellae]